MSKTFSLISSTKIIRFLRFFFLNLSIFVKLFNDRTLVSLRDVFANLVPMTQLEPRTTRFGFCFKTGSKYLNLLRNRKWEKQILHACIGKLALLIGIIIIFLIKELSPQESPTEADLQTNSCMNDHGTSKHCMHVVLNFRILCFTASL